LAGCTNFGHIFDTGAEMSKVISGVIGPKFTKVLYDVARSSPLLTRPSALRYSNPFQNGRSTNEGIWVVFALKLVAMTTSFKRSGKEGGIIHLRAIPTV